MGIDWEGLLGVEGAALADAYDACVARAMEWDDYVSGRRDYLPSVSFVDDDESLYTWEDEDDETDADAESDAAEEKGRGA